MAEELTAMQRWIEMRKKAGFRSDRALEKALKVSQGQIWRWIHMNREPSLFTMRELKRLLGVSLDTLDETIVSMRAEATQPQPAPDPVGGGSVHQHYDTPPGSGNAAAAQPGSSPAGTAVAEEPGAHDQH